MVRLTLILGTVAAALVAFGYLFYLNPEQVTVQLSATRQWQAPLPLVLLASFLIGAALTLAVSLVRESRHALAGWRLERGTRRARRHQVRKDQGLGLSWLGELDKARALLAKALRDRPDDLSAFLLFARTYLKERDFRRALDILEEGLDRRGPDPKLLLFLAEAQRGLGEVGAAAETLERARRADGTSPRVLAALRDTYVAAGRWRDAADAQEAWLLAVRDRGAHRDAEPSLVGMRYQSALVESDPAARAVALRALLRAHPDFEPAAVSLGDTLLALGNERQAERVWRRALARNIRGGVLDRLERMLRGSPRVRHLDALSRRLVRRDPAHGTVRLFRARQLVRDGRLDEAAAELTQVAPPWSSLAAYHALVAELHVRRGAYDDAITAFRHALAAGALGTFQCEACGTESDEWRGFCAECQRWGTYRSGLEVSASAPPIRGERASPRQPGDRDPTTRS